MAAIIGARCGADDVDRRDGPPHAPSLAPLFLLFDKDAMSGTALHE